MLFLERVNDVTRLLVDPARDGHDEELQHLGNRRQTGRAEQRLSAVTNVATRRASSVESAHRTASIGFLDSTRAMASVAVGPTVDRSVLGILVDFAKAIPYYFAPGPWGETTLRIVEERLAETPCHAARSWDRFQCSWVLTRRPKWKSPV